MYDAQVNLLNHIKTGYSVSIPTASILFSKLEERAEQRTDPLPAIYTLFSAADVYDNADDKHTIPVAVVVASNHHNKNACYRDAMALTSGITRWLLTNKFFSGSTRNYQVHSPIHMEPYKTTERYTIAILIVTLEDRK